jgi:hypothetical protein
MSNHTPGPWEAIEWSCHAPTTVVTEHLGHRILIAECSGGGRSAAESIDDARLIAAAPELLEALRVFVNYMKHAGDKSITRKSLAYPLHLAEAAIRKANSATETEVITRERQLG